MAIPNIEDFTALLDERARDYLGETIEYAANGVTFADIKGHVDYRDMVKAMEISQAIAQDITVAMLMSDVPVKPSATVRLRLAKRAGKDFKPLNVRSDESGTHWEFEVQEVRT
jgi:hypothetical protein